MKHTNTRVEVSMPVSTSDQQAECDWVVERCKAHLLRDDRSAAKAWILTARSLFPDNFDVQYEAFLLHSSCKEMKEAALTLSDLCVKFPKEKKLQNYLSEITAAVTAGNKKLESLSKAMQMDAKDKQELFSFLPPQVKKKILLQASENTTDVLTRCQIWLVIIKLFPDTAKTLGLDLYDVLSQQPSNTYSTVADNPYRELLVIDVVPMLAESPEVTIERPITRTNGQVVVLKTSHLCQWLESAACYYTTLTAQALLLRKEHVYSGKQGWESLYRLFMMTAEKCSWREVLHSKQIGPHLAANTRWHGLEKISGYSNHLQSFEAPRSVAIACFYISVFLFFEMAWTYCKDMLYYEEDSSGEGNTGEVQRHPWILIEDTLTKQGMDEKPVKRRKLEESYNQATLHFCTGSKQRDLEMSETFLVAINCWDFLQSNVTYRGEFSRLCQQWGAFEWDWLNSFRSDMALYKGDHNLAMQILEHECHKIETEAKSKPLSLRIIMQMVNCSVVLGDVKGSCNFASEIISLVPLSDTRREDVLTDSQNRPPPVKPSSQTRLLKLLSCATDDLLSYCVQVIIRTLKDVTLANPKNEKALGQLLVLVQYQWPQHEDMFASIITTIQKRRKFNFPEFFKYVIVVDILEEMMFLCNSDSLQINLLDQETNTKARTVTRGVNRGARVDLVGAMERQIRRCDEPVEPLLRTFFTQEKLSIDTA